MNQGTLFNNGSEQATNSRNAFTELQNSGKLTGAQKLVMKIVEREGGTLTAREIARHCYAAEGKDEETYRKRVKELVDDFRLKECESRKCTVTGRNVTTYAKA